MTNEERWNNFITELRGYIEVHQLGPSKHTALFNQCRYYRKMFRLASEPLSPEMERRKQELEEVLSMRDLTIHTGGRRKIDKCKIEN